MTQSHKKTSLWVWLLLAIIIASFVAFILFLDRNIVSNAQRQPAQDAPEKNTRQPVFDFYTVLPEREVDIPLLEDDAPAKKKATIRQPPPKKGDRYLMQVGSYQSLRDADRQKAQLALLGLQASISTAQVAGVTYYRVEMGPYDARQYSSVQKSLIENDVDFLPKKVR